MGSVSTLSKPVWVSAGVNVFDHSYHESRDPWTTFCAREPYTRLQLTVHMSRLGVHAVQAEKNPVNGVIEYVPAGREIRTHCWLFIGAEFPEMQLILLSMLTT